MKKKSIYHKKLKRIIQAALLELEMGTLKSMTTDEIRAYFEKIT